MIFHPGDLDVGGAQIHFAWQNFEPLVSRGFYFFEQTAFAEQNTIRACTFDFFEADTAGRIGLWIKIKKQDALAERGEAGGKVDGGGRLPDSAFLVGDGDDFGWHFLIK